MSLTFDNEDQDILASYERDEWQSIADLDQELERYRQYAATHGLHRNIRIRLAPEDFEQLQQQAQSAGVSREMLIEQIIHQYIVGELVERS